MVDYHRIYSHLDIDKSEQYHLPKVFYNFDKMFSTIKYRIKSISLSPSDHTPQPIGNGQNTFRLVSSSRSPQPQDGVGQMTP